MSPRAAWRLEALGYTPVYDYTGGKADWLGAGLPTVRRESGPARVADVMDRSAPTCRAADRVADVVASVAQTGAGWVVVNDVGVVLGRLRADQVDRGEATVEEAMEPGPTTVRADADLAQTIERMRGRHVTSLIVSTPEGVLLGVVHAQPDMEIHE
ncbi:MAG: CBS domain-containing protein [Acidimicrobiales bacterium]